MNSTLAARTREIALTLTGWPSVTGTAEEAGFATKLADYLRAGGLEQSWTVPITNDALGRANVFALKRGSGRRLVVLTGHFDTVPAADYGALMPFAFLPEPLRDRMIARLRQTGEHPLALADLESGDYLPGRGLLDMKSELAAGIAVLEAHDGIGSLLLVATPDEEDRSAGMRAAAPVIGKIAAEHGLDVTLVINLDSIADDGDGNFGRSLALGSIGKLLLTALVVGREAHACYPFSGVNSAYLAGELLSEFECAPELAEISGAEIAAPPTALHTKDLKSGYNVTTPAQAWLYWNTLQHKRSPDEVLDIALGLAKRAMARAGDCIGERAKALSQSVGSADIPVLTYAELARTIPENDIKREGAKLAQRGELDLPTQALKLTEYAWARSGRSGPAVILGFGSIPYRAVSLGDARLERFVLAAAGGDVNPILYFPGISDMSFLGQGSGDLALCAANTPNWGTSFKLDALPGYPVINIGPWGRDYHHWLERLNTTYAFGILPGVVERVARAVIEAD